MVTRAVKKQIFTQAPQGASVDDLVKLAGSLDDEAAREMKTVIEEGCERVDLDAW